MTNSSFLSWCFCIADVEIRDVMVTCNVLCLPLCYYPTRPLKW